MQQLSLSFNEIELVFNHLPPKLKWNFFATELFGRIFFLNEAQEQLNETIYRYLR